MMHNVRLSGAGEATLVNYTKFGAPYVSTISIWPINSVNFYGDTFTSHYFSRTIVLSETLPKRYLRLLSREQREGYKWVVANSSSTPPGSENEFDKGDEEFVDMDSDQSESCGNSSTSEGGAEDGGDSSRTSEKCPPQLQPVIVKTGGDADEMFKGGADSNS